MLASLMLCLSPLARDTCYMGACLPSSWVRFVSFELLACLTLHFGEDCIPDMRSVRRSRCGTDVSPLKACLPCMSSAFDLLRASAAMEQISNLLAIQTVMWPFLERSLAVLGWIAVRMTLLLLALVRGCGILCQKRQMAPATTEMQNLASTAG